jgi:hypothetical protein
MICTKSGMRQLEEPVIRISFASSQFTQGVPISSSRSAVSSGRRSPSAASGRVDLPQQPQKSVAFIRAQPNPRIRHLDHLDIFPLRIQGKRKRTRRAYR